MIFRLEYKNKENTQARLDITTPGSSIVKEIEGTEHPFLLSYKGDKSDKSFHFMTSSAEINIYETPEFNIDALKTSSETQIRVDHYIDDKLNWTGFVIPDFFSREIGGAGIVSMTASDRISTLKGVTLSDLPAMVQIRDLAVRCLERTGLDLPLKTMADFRATELGFNQYFRSEIASQRLYDNKGRSISCYDILKSILVASGSTLRQRGGEWHIINKLQHEAGVGRVYNTENTSVDYVESVHHFDEIVKGARRTIIPVAGSVGIYHEYGGGKLHPDNYNFSQGLTGWTPVGGFEMGIEDSQVKGYKQSTPGYPLWEPDLGDATGKNKLANIKNESAGFSGTNLNERPYVKATVPLVYAENTSSIDISANISITSQLNNSVVWVLLAEKGTTQLGLTLSGSFEPFVPTEDRFKHRLSVGGEGVTENPTEVAYDGVALKKGTLSQESLSGFSVTLRIYGSGPSVTSFVNFASLSFRSTQEIAKGVIYKRDQGSDFTKTHDIETAIFGDYLTTGKDGYFYPYPIDDTSSIHNPYSGISSLWTTPYFPTETDAIPILQHVVRQQARMFSVAHDLISGEIEIERFDPLSIFVDCNGKRYVIVSASFDFLRSSVKVELEEIAYANLTVRDFIYSYFGDGESGISSVGGISAGSGSGGSGGGLTPEQIEILSFWKKDPDNPNTIFTEMNAYSKLELSAYGAGDGGGGGGGTMVTWGATVNNYSLLTVEGEAKNVALSGHKHAWSDLVDLPNTLSGYGITDAYTKTQVDQLLDGVGTGSVTSVGMTVPTGLTVTGSPITTSGTLALGLQSGYSIPTTVKQGQWDTAYSNNHTHSNKTVLDGITSGLVGNWNTAFSNTHTHSNKAQLDLITQSNIDVLAKLSIVNGNLQIDGNAYATGELSAYGAGDGGGGGGGIIEIVHDYSKLGQTFDNDILTDTFNAYTINQINTRLVSVENGSATTVNTTGTGNAITSISKSGSVITANKDLAFLETSIFNTHNNDNVRHITGAERTKWDKVVTDFGNLEIGGRNLLKNTNRRIEHSNYLMESFYLGDVKPQTGERVTIAFKGELSLNKTFWQLFVNGTVDQASNLTVSDKGADGVWRKTFTWNAGSSGNTYLNIYSAPGTQSGISWIEDVMLVFGNKIAYYSKAPEDVQAEIDLKAPIASPTFTGTVTAPTFIGALNGNASSATKLQTARTIWGQSFDGTGNVTGALSGATTGSFTGAVIGGSNSYFTKVSPINIPALGVTGHTFSVLANSAYGILTGALATGRSYLQVGRIDSNTAVYDLMFQPLGGNVSIGLNNTGALAKLHVVGNILSTGTTTTTKVIFNAAGWSMEQVGSELQMKHNNVVKMRFTSTGSIIATNEITAFG